MESILNHSAELLILIFLVITFLMSVIDKVSDWNGNLSFLKAHFENTYVPPLLPITLIIILILVTLVLFTDLSKVRKKLVNLIKTIKDKNRKKGS